MSTTNFFDDIVSDGRDIDEECVAGACFEHYDQDGDSVLNMREFVVLAGDLFTDRKGNPYDLPMRMTGEMFYSFDLNRDGKLDFEEFLRLWKLWITPIVRPVSALIVIDVQNDFIDGSLAIRNCPAGQEGGDVVPVINNLLETVPFTHVIYTYDWHPEDHVSFIDNVSLRSFHPNSKLPAEEAKVFDTVIFEGPPEIEQKLWPRHCVQNSWGSQLHSDLDISENAIFIYKGTCSDIDSYSAFWDNEKRSQTNLVNELKERNVTDIFVCGLAYDYCVGYTALHALELGYRTVLIDDACRGVLCEEIENMKSKLVRQHGVVVTSEAVKGMVEGKDRRPELGYRTAMITSMNNEDSDND